MDLPPPPRLTPWVPLLFAAALSLVWLTVWSWL
jgi:hypothetical protein